MQTALSIVEQSGFISVRHCFSITVSHSVSSTISHLNKFKINKERLEKIIIEASEQSNRINVPIIEDIQDLNSFLKTNSIDLIFTDLNSNNNKIDKVKNISNLLKTNNNQVEKKVEQLIEENQRINKELKSLKKNPVTTDKNNSVKETIKGIIFEYVIFDDLAIKELKSNAEKIIKNN